MGKSARLRRLVESEELSFLMEAHNGLSAKIAEEAGFEGIWASGLSISAALGVRDNNEASWTQVLEVARVHGRRHDGPDPARRRHRLRQLQQRAPPRAQARAARRRRRVHRGQALPEDQQLPRASGQPLADIDEFAGKIKAGKDAQTRRRLRPSSRASRRSSPAGGSTRRCVAPRPTAPPAPTRSSSTAAQRVADEILAFKREWGDRAPGA